VPVRPTRCASSSARCTSSSARCESKVSETAYALIGRRSKPPRTMVYGVWRVIIFRLESSRPRTGFRTLAFAPRFRFRLPHGVRSCSSYVRATSSAARRAPHAAYRLCVSPAGRRARSNHAARRSLSTSSCAAPPVTGPWGSPWPVELLAPWLSAARHRATPQPWRVDSRARPLSTRQG
jgi:hypothetical protein